MVGIQFQMKPFMMKMKLKIKMEKKYQNLLVQVEWVEEESYFFKLSAWTNKLLDHYKKNKEFILPTSRKNEVIKFVEKGLKIYQ